MGQFQVEDLLTHPQATFKQLGRGGVEVRVPDGRAMRYDADGRLAGFID
jgi:filamentous hemagglutinin